MSYIAKTPDGSPFAQNTSSTSGNISIASGRMDTVSEDWLDTDHGTNGYSFTGNGFIYGALTVGSGTASMTCWVLSNSSGDRFTGGEIQTYNYSSRAVSDDEAIAYGDNTSRYALAGNYGVGNLTGSDSRINVIRME